MNPNYNQNYTRDEIDAILQKIKSCVEKKQIFNFPERKPPGEHRLHQ